MINYVIPPLKNLDLYELGSAGFFCLAQLYKKDLDYRLFVADLKSRNIPILLDNGAGDHDPLTNSEVFDLMRHIQPNIVVPLDTLCDKNQTIRQFEEFIDWMVDESLIGTVKILAVPQGRNKAEWLECYKFFLNHPYVDIIGMSKIGVPYAWIGATDDKNIMEGRHTAIEHLVWSRLISKPLHFLGMGDPSEVKLYAHLNKHSLKECFLSTDSCNVIWSAMNGLDWSKGETQRIKTPMDYFDRELTEEQEELAKKNAEVFNTFLT